MNNNTKIKKITLIVACVVTQMLTAAPVVMADNSEALAPAQINASQHNTIDTGEQKDEAVERSSRQQDVATIDATKPDHSALEQTDELSTTAGGFAETDLKARLVKLSITLVLLIALLYAIFFGLRRTPMYKQMADNPIKVKSMLPLGGKNKLLLVEVFDTLILLSANDQSVQLIKEIDRSKAISSEPEQSQIHTPDTADKSDQAVFEKAFSGEPNKEA